ncbi:MAG: hypothetical protein ACYDAN_13725 [Candidatus Limnocylindrales bacterium]
MDDSDVDALRDAVRLADLHAASRERIGGEPAADVGRPTPSRPDATAAPKSAPDAPAAPPESEPGAPGRPRHAGTILVPRERRPMRQR